MSVVEMTRPTVGDATDEDRCRVMVDGMQRLAGAVQDHGWVGHLDMPDRSEVGAPDVGTLTLGREGCDPVVDIQLEVSSVGALYLGTLALAIDRQAAIGSDALPDVAIGAAAALAADSAIAAGIFDEPEADRPDRSSPAPRRRSRSHLQNGTRRERRGR